MSLPIKAEIPSSFSPAVTKGKSPLILSSLFNRLPRVALPNIFLRLYSPHSTFSNFLLSGVTTFPNYPFLKY